METSAKLKSVRLSPQKTRLVVDMVRGKAVQEALNILKFSPQRPADVVAKLVRSAVANAEQKGIEDVDRLFVKAVFVERRFVSRPATLRWSWTRSNHLRRCSFGSESSSNRVSLRHNPDMGIKLVCGEGLRSAVTRGSQVTRLLERAPTPRWYFQS
jgi:large subunit ribosomal protein L22